MDVEIHKPVSVNKEDDQWIEVVDAKGDAVMLRMIEDNEYLDEDYAIAQHVADAINAYKG